MQDCEIRIAARLFCLYCQNIRPAALSSMLFPFDWLNGYLAKRILQAMSKHTINLFISHAWKYSSHYETLHGWIFNSNWRSGQASLSFKDYSIPKDDPVHTNGTDKQLKEAIDVRLSKCNVILVVTGVYSTYSKWIKKEVELAQQYDKAILSVTPHGAKRTSAIVTGAATKSVGWTKKSVVDGIWKLHRGISNRPKHQ